MTEISSPSSKRLIRSLTYLTWIIIAISYFLMTFGIFAFPYPIGYGEGPIIDQAVRLANFENIYRSDLPSPPYTVSNYPPIFPLLQVPLIWIFGPTFWGGRLICLLSATAIGICIWRITKTLIQSSLAAHLAAILFVGNPFVMRWAILGRVDLPALALALTGLTLLVVGPISKRTMLVAALLATLAIYTKQSLLLTAIVPATYWIYARVHKGAALKFLGGTLFFLAVLFLFLNLVTHGGFAFHTITANVNELKVSQLNRYLPIIFTCLPVLTAVGLYALVDKEVRAQPGFLLFTVFLITSVISLAAIAKVGSSWNYALEFFVALSLLAALVLARWQHRSSLLPLTSLLLVFQFYFSAFIQPHSGLLYSNAVALGFRPTEELNDLAVRIRSAPGITLSDRHMGFELQAGRRIYFQPFIMTQLAQQGLWDESSFVDDIQKQKFSLITIYRPDHQFPRDERWTVAMQRAIQEKYTQEKLLADTAIYIPKL